MGWETRISEGMWAAFKEMDLTMSESFILIAIQHHLNSKGEGAFPGRPRLMKMCRCGLSTITRSIKGLVEKGAIVCVRSRGKPNKYSLGNVILNLLGNQSSVKLTPDQVQIDSTVGSICNYSSVKLTPDHSHRSFPINNTTDQEKKSRRTALSNSQKSDATDTLNSLHEYFAKVMNRPWDLEKKKILVADDRNRALWYIKKYGIEECRRAIEGFPKVSMSYSQGVPKHFPQVFPKRRVNNKLESKPPGDPSKFMIFVEAGNSGGKSKQLATFWYLRKQYSRAEIEKIASAIKDPEQVDPKTESLLRAAIKRFGNWNWSQKLRDRWER